ncbi:MAG: Asd/ArgC dimerization domain-containing protein [Gemmatimonadales bacterium]
MAARTRSSGLRVAILGASSLKGKELKEVLEERQFPVKKLTLLDDDEALGQLTDFEGEPTFVRTIAPDTFTESDLVFFASTAGAFTRAHWPQAAAGPAALIDLTHALLDVPEAVVRVPFLDPHLLPTPNSGLPAGQAGCRWFIAPHAAAIVLLTLLARLSGPLRLRQVVANVFEPVSERGSEGMDELQEQTVRLLSFKEFPRAVFDAQVAFNLLPRYGADSPARLEEVEDTIRREIERCAPALADRLALRVLQAPIFHAHCLSVLAELEEPFEVSAVERALRGERVALLSPEEAPAAPVDVAGREDIVVGPVLRDQKRPAAFWLWTVVDNLRLTARTAVEIAESFVA